MARPVADQGRGADQSLAEGLGDLLPLGAGEHSQNKPYDQFARELITGSGSNFRDGPANYVRAVPERDPRTLGEATALLFLGARLSCARCHAHPVENWGRDDDLGMAAFFSQVKIKFTSEWKEQIVCRDPDQVLLHPRTGKAVAPRPLGSTALEGDGQSRSPPQVRRLAHRAAESLVRQEHRQSDLVLAHGAGDRSRARRHASDESARESRPCWSTWRRNWSAIATT